MHSLELIQQLDRALPQTQCTRCGYPDCHAYARAMAAGEAEINQCPPGGSEGVQRLAALTGRPALPLNPTHGQEGPRHLAVIDEAWCIGCTLCLKACPVDAIAGAAKQMHVVVNDQCTGCELCVPACPVDCISLLDVTPGRSGWTAWTAAQAQASRDRHDGHRARRKRDRLESEARIAQGSAPGSAPGPTSAPTSASTAPALPAVAVSPLASPPVDAAERKRAAIEAALARARAKR